MTVRDKYFYHFQTIAYVIKIIIHLKRDETDEYLQLCYARLLYDHCLIYSLIQPSNKMDSVVIQSHDSAECSDQQVLQRTSSRDEDTGDIRSKIMKKLSVVPCIGLIMAFLSSVFFASASFTVELIPGIDAAFIVATR